MCFTLPSKSAQHLVVQVAGERRQRLSVAEPRANVGDLQKPVAREIQGPLEIPIYFRFDGRVTSVLPELL